MKALIFFWLSAASAVAHGAPIEGVERTVEWACRVYIKNPHAELFDKKDPSRPAEELNMRSLGEEESRSVSVFADQQTCDAVERRDPSFFIRANAWYRASDFVTERNLEPISRWTTRYYLKVDNAIEFGPVEYSKSWGPKQRWLENSQREISAYQQDAVDDAVELFTEDGRWIDLRHRITWKMHLSPDGTLVLRDTQGKYLPGFHGNPVCHRDEMQRLVCSHAREMAPETFHYGKLADQGNTDPGVAFTVAPDRITVVRRVQGIRHPDDLLPLEISARFSDPVRPVYFGRGVLFAPGAKPNGKGFYKNGDLLQVEVCVADCPEQIRLQQSIAK